MGTSKLKRLILFFAFFFAWPAFADTITLPFTFSPNTLIQSAQVNQDFSTVYNAFNGSISDVNIKNGANINANKIAALQFKAARATITSGQPVADGSGSTLYIDPYDGSQVAFYDGVANWIACTQNEQSMNLTGLAIGAYDIYEYNSSGVATVETPPTAWVNTFTPPSRQTVNGITLKGTDGTRRLICSIYLAATSTLTDTVARRDLSNVLNPIPRKAQAFDNTASWTTTNATWRAANGVNTVGVSTIEWFQALSRYPTFVTNRQQVASDTGSASTFIGIALDQNSSADVLAFYQAFTANAKGVVVASNIYSPQIGLHTLYRVEEVASGTGMYFGTLLDCSMDTIIYN